MGHLTSTTSSLTFLKSQLASSLAPLQVHPGRGETPTPSQLIYFMPYYSPISWYPIPSLLMNILLHGLEMSTALSRSHRQEGLRGPGGTGVQPGERGEPENSKPLNYSTRCAFYALMFYFRWFAWLIIWAGEVPQPPSLLLLPLLPFTPLSQEKYM